MPTPRESIPWSANLGIALELASQVRDRELVLSRRLELLDIARSGRLRHLRILLEDYVSVFRSWQEKPPKGERPRELREFSALLTLASTCIAE